MKKLKNYTAVPSCTWAYLVLPSPYLPVREAAAFLGWDLGDQLPSLSRCGGGGFGGSSATAFTLTALRHHLKRKMCLSVSKTEQGSASLGEGANPS